MSAEARNVQNVPTEGEASAQPQLAAGGAEEGGADEGGVEEGNAEGAEETNAATSPLHGRWGGMQEKLPQSKHPGVSWSKVCT